MRAASRSALAMLGVSARRTWTLRCMPYPPGVRERANPCRALDARPAPSTPSRRRRRAAAGRSTSCSRWASPDLVWACVDSGTTVVITTCRRPSDWCSSPGSRSHVVGIPRPTSPTPLLFPPLTRRHDISQSSGPVAMPPRSLIFPLYPPLFLSREPTRPRQVIFRRSRSVLLSKPPVLLLY